MIQNKGTTPVMRQFWDIKRKYPNNIILFRMGDFYETFDEDALLSSSILGITLTKRANGAASKVPLAGFPFHSLEQYIHKLTKAGHSVAICEQVEDPKTTKGIVKREVVEIVTPGTSISDKFLSKSENNFILSIMLEKNENGIAILDISTGEFTTGCIKDDEILNTILNHEPKEILVSDSQKSQLQEILKSNNYFISTSQNWIWQKNFAYDELKNIFKVSSLKGFGIEDNINGISASGALIYYLKNIDSINLEGNSFDLNDKEYKKLKDLSSKIDNKTALLFWQFTIKTLEEINVVSSQHIAIEMFIIRLLYLKEIRNTNNKDSLKTDKFEKEQSFNLKKPIENKNNNELINQLKNISQSEEPQVNIDNKKIEDINSFNDLIKVCAKKKEMSLKFELETNVNLVSFEKNRIEISFNENLKKDFVKLLSAKLYEWTNSRWIIMFLLNQLLKK